jgi:hypothetical protein
MSVRVTWSEGSPDRLQLPPDVDSPWDYATPSGQAAFGR